MFTIAPPVLPRRVDMRRTASRAHKIDSDFVEHDFHAIFTRLDVLGYDTKIAAVVRVLGWCGMVGVVGWMAARSRKCASAN
jgi:hypothetical protein